MKHADEWADTVFLLHVHFTCHAKNSSVSLV